MYFFINKVQFYFENKENKENLCKNASGIEHVLGAFCLYGHTDIYTPKLDFSKK